MLLDGCDVRCIPLPRLRQLLGIVPQHPFIISGTIRWATCMWGVHYVCEGLRMLVKDNLIITKFHLAHSRQLQRGTRMPAPCAESLIWGTCTTPLTQGKP